MKLIVKSIIICQIFSDNDVINYLVSFYGSSAVLINDMISSIHYETLKKAENTKSLDIVYHVGNDSVLCSDSR
jgi:hypothetical protein